MRPEHQRPLHRRLDAAHYDDQARKVEIFNKYANVGAEMIPRERLREMMASDYYYGGMYVKRGGHLHPARYYKGLLEAAPTRGRGAVRQHRGRAHREDRKRLARVDRQGPDRVPRKS